MNALEGVLSEDERITRQRSSSGGAELIVQVADARNLRRALMLTSQLAAIGTADDLVLNMVDEAHRARHHGRRRRPRPTAGHSGDRGGRDRRAGASPNCATAASPPGLTRAAHPHAQRSHIVWADATAERLRRIRHDVAGRCPGDDSARAVREPLTGLPILAVVLYVDYLFVGVFGAQTLVGLLEGRMFTACINPAATAAGARTSRFRSSATSSSASTA